jgi:hypothetical protein
VDDVDDIDLSVTGSQDLLAARAMSRRTEWNAVSSIMCIIPISLGGEYGA